MRRMMKNMTEYAKGAVMPNWELSKYVYFLQRVAQGSMLLPNLSKIYIYIYILYVEDRVGDIVHLVTRTCERHVTGQVIS